MSLKFAKRMEHVEPSIIREFARLINKPEIISFAGGAPASELFPIEELKDISNRTLENDGRASLHYSDTAGNVPLREKLVDRMKSMGVETTVDNIHIISGSQQGIDYGARIFLDPGDVVICELPTYVGAINAFKSYEAAFASIPMDDDGIIIEEFEKILETTPNCKLAYVIPDFQNPSGTVWSEERRKQFIKLINKYNLPVIEDHPYGALRYEGESIPPLKAFDTEENVLFLGTFSKILCPGLRVAWICASKNILGKYYMIKGSADLQTSSFDQAIVNEYLETHDLDMHIDKIKAVYRKRRDRMIGIMNNSFPKKVNYTRPAGGFFTWVELPEKIKSDDLMEMALKQNVAIIPGTSFYASNCKENTVRMSYSAMPEEKISEGMKILIKVLEETLRQ
jgi:2-aminoadipate transaminase